MRLLIYYKPNKDKFFINYTQDRQHELYLDSVNCYGHVIIQYWYILDNQIFFSRKYYEKYLKRKSKHKLRNLKYKVGQAIIKFGRFVCFGREEKVKVVYVYKYPWWLKR